MEILKEPLVIRLSETYYLGIDPKCENDKCGCITMSIHKDGKIYEQISELFW